ncbi:Cytochrome P450 10 [Mytilus edulis]|uniref:Cytochrome P450 10 n=1 Tax=Mytilus edulis TaxID=6550 RepID=A0A8S3VF37_MYTED|nr:Cytochrome P450 10 [Mytilus edulis]
MRNGTNLIQAITKNSQRVVSTTAASKQSTKVLTIDEVTRQTCPFRKSLDKIESVLRPREQIKSLIPNSEIQSFQNVPGPKGLPIVGTLFDYFKKDGPRFNKMFEAYRQRAIEYGPIYKERKLVQYHQQGEEWHKHRTVVSKKMLKMKEVLGYCGEMDTVADDFMKHLVSRRDNHYEIQGLETDIFKWAMESIGTFLFEERIGCLGEKTNPQAQDFIVNLQGFFKLMQPLMYNVPLYKIYPTKTWRQYEEYTDNILRIGRSFVDKKVAHLQTAGTQDDDRVSFLTYLLSQQSLTPDEALSTAVDLLVGATETTTTGSLWVLYNLAKNPEVQEKLYRETQNILHDNEPITPEKLSQLSYVKAVVKETFRLYPITFATSRHIEDKLEVGGYMLPAGTHVQANLYGMFHDPALYPDPESFKPERWLQGEMDRTLKSLSNLVWGHGARMCIGRRFAEQEIHIMLTKIVQNFKLEYDNEDIEPVLNTVMTPDRPLRLKFIPRSA